jgi:hypothetical protein
MGQKGTIFHGGSPPPPAALQGAVILFFSVNSASIKQFAPCRPGRRIFKEVLCDDIIRPWDFGVQELEQSPRVDDE